ncbi:hypothetical protein [Plantactinospora soyae]|uniref:Uncharacterized protein n=1 Tax=Plantactinospora soyae TaxID=1544732 RepID=A0A927M758_9ACTN|nr:hypothetical protein [Plantactinospora soyae]MBE1486623.1 hypothetical protein [Plantactinospora soyae]
MTWVDTPYCVHNSDVDGSLSPGFSSPDLIRSRISLAIRYPEKVYAYLRRLADELDHLVRAESTARAEAELASQELRQWRIRHHRCWFVEPGRRTPNRGPW